MREGAIGKSAMRIAIKSARISDPQKYQLRPRFSLCDSWRSAVTATLASSQGAAILIQSRESLAAHQEIKTWFAWRPVQASLIYDPDAPFDQTWSGKLPAKRFVWLRTIWRVRENGEWVYYKPARPETYEEWADRQW